MTESDFVRVPREPTKKMLRAWEKGVQRFYAEKKVFTGDDLDNARAAGYRAMLTALSPAPASKGPMEADTTGYDFDAERPLS